MDVAGRGWSPVGAITSTTQEVDHSSPPPAPSSPAHEEGYEHHEKVTSIQSSEPFSTAQLESGQLESMATPVEEGNGITESSFQVAESGEGGVGSTLEPSSPENAEPMEVHAAVAAHAEPEVTDSSLVSAASAHCRI